LRTLYHAQRFPRHTHDTFTFGLGLRGTGSIWYHGQHHARGPGDIVVIPPGEVHTGGVGRGAKLLSYLAVYVPAQVWAVCADAEQIRSAEAMDLRSPVLQDAAVAAALRRLNAVLWPTAICSRSPRRNGTSSGFADADAAEDALHVALGALLRHLSRGHSRPPNTALLHGEPQLVRIVREILDDCYSDRAQTSLHALAGRTGVTSFHLVRAFTRVTGRSPHQYLLQVRVQRARQLLAAGEPPSLVAAIAGFA